MARKPYHSKLANDWFIKQPHFFHYMVREFTCVGIGIYILNLMAGIVALSGSPESWMNWIITQKNPVMIVIAIFAFISAIYHSYTWFGVTPKVFKIPKGDKFVPGKYIIFAHWIVFTVVAIVLCLIVNMSA